MELVEDAVRVGPYVLNVLRPRNAEALIDEARFDEDEFMPYWAELWPSGVALAEAVVEVDVRGKRTVELGCGLALPSLVAALGGATALATDWSPEAVRLAGENAARNGVALETAHVDWTDPEQLVERGPFDLVLCSDVLYEPRNVDALLDLLPRLGDDVLLAEPGRQTAGRFFEAADVGWQIGRLGKVSRLRRK
jgi:predicted nicotinamide N-methyase